MSCVHVVGSIAVAVALSCPPESAEPPAAPAVTEPQTVQAPTAQPSSSRYQQTDPRYGLLTPLPENGGLPPIVDMLYGPTPQELDFRARSRDYAKQIGLIRHKHFGDKRVPEIRQAGLEQLREFTDPAAFRPMFEELRREDDEIRLALLDHFASQGELGQAALAWVAIYAANEEKTAEREAALRNEATRRMTQPPSIPVIQVLDGALRSQTHRVANNAGALAGSLNALQTIPLLIFAQVTGDAVREQGDLAWIAIGTQQLFVVDVNPVVGNGVVAFEPVVSVINEGVVLRVVDAVAMSYRVDVHRSLVAMSTMEWGQSTEPLGYDPQKWWAWYNTEFVPHMQKKLEIARLAEPPQPEKPAGTNPPGSG